MQVHYLQHSAPDYYYIQFWDTLVKGNKNYREFEGGQINTTEMLKEMGLARLALLSG